MHLWRAFGGDHTTHAQALMSASCRVTETMQADIFFASVEIRLLPELKFDIYISLQWGIWCKIY